MQIKKLLARINLILLFPLVFNSIVLAQEKQAPNIIVILADDQGWNALSTTADPNIPNSGSTYFRTPNIDQLAKAGTRFSQAYSGGSTCSPSRHSIQFGRTPSSLGMLRYAGCRSIPVDYGISLANLLKKSNPEYVTAHFGKWHLVPTPEELGYDESDGKTHNRDGSVVDFGNDPKQIFSLTKKTNDFIEKQVQAGRPFFVQLSHYANHLTYQAKAETIEKYRIQYAQNKTKYHHDALWAAMNENLDESVGNILSKIKELGIERNTYIIYTADNGYENKKDASLPAENRGFYKAYPQRAHKYTLSEGGIRVPMIISGPKINKNAVCRIPVHGMDILPTVLDFSGEKDNIPECVEGSSLLPLLQGEKQIDRKRKEFVFRYAVAKYKSETAIIRGKYKLLKDLETGKIYLWDLSKDIGESHDISKERPELTKDMNQKMSDYFEKVGWKEKPAEKPADNSNYNKKIEK